MADALISVTIKIAVETALSLATDRIGVLFGFKDDLASMTRSLGLIRALLSDAEERQGQDLVVQQWLKNLKGVVFDADNVLDELNYHFLRHKVESRNQPKRKVCFFFSFSNSITVRWRMASKVRDIKLKLNNINQEANELGLVSRLAMKAAFPAPAGDTTSRQTDSVVAPTIGRANDESKIVNMLLSPSEKVVSVIPVTGMGGLGKTTLAKLIYNNDKVDGHFEKKFWVCVSKKVQIMELFKLILVQLTGEKVEVDDRNVIVEKIRKQLQEKRYFLVLDDVWNHEQGFWDDYFITMKGLNPTNGSWCLITTRLERLAHTLSRLLMMDVEPYFLGRLPDSDCWSILKEKAIGREEEPEELKAVRDRVTKRCNGLPLAARVIGGLLRLSAKGEWRLTVEKSHLSDDQSGVEQILKVSFDYLSPASIKKCFAYCSIFPKDTEMGRDSLIELWMAEGFLRPNLESETVMEKIGDKYLRVLVQSSLFEEIIDYRGVRYKMHDLVHDLAESVSEADSINLETGVIDSNFQVRYLAANSFGEKTLKQFENTSTSVRTLFLEGGISGEMLLKFKNLHVLNLSGRETCELPTTIDKLIHLRYIDLTYSSIIALPESLCKLYNLQSLKLIDCYSLKGLPKGLSNLISLRHLHYVTYDSSLQMPLEIGRLSSLQTLEFFNVGREKGRRIEELGCLKDLKGNLRIRNLELIKGKKGAEKANLNEKQCLFGLMFEWCSENQEGDNSHDEDVLEGLRPHSNLQELEIRNFMGVQFPQWFLTLSRLVVLRLTDCKGCREVPSALGQLPSLQCLKLSGLGSIRSIGLSFYGIDNHSSSSSGVPRTFFPALETLSLDKMENLVEWMGAEEVRSTTTTTTGGGEGEVVHVFPVLKYLWIEDCSQLTTVPSHFPSLKSFGIKNNNHVSVVKNILLSQLTSCTLSSLTIEDMDGLTLASDIMAVAGLHTDNNIIFQNLEHLCLERCPIFTSISGWLGTCLESLTLRDCANLRELSAEDLFEFPSLHMLCIQQCPRIVIFPKALPNYTSLVQLIIGGCHELTNLPGEMPKSLRLLRVYDCPNLVSFQLDLQQTPSLASFELSGCPKLKTDMAPKGFGFLTSLWKVSVGPFSDDDENSSSSSPVFNEFDWSGLRSSSTLRQLGLYGLPQMESLPHQLQYLTNLTTLLVTDFGGLEALPDWIGNLESLSQLCLTNCENLRCLPSMDAMRRLTNLRYLDIMDCPLLKERCSRPPQTSSSTHSEWSKISHNTFVSFD